MDRDLCKNIFYFLIFSFFLGFKHDFIRCVDLPASQLQTQQTMMSLIRSHIEYLIQTYYFVVIL